MKITPQDRSQPKHFYRRMLQIVAVFIGTGLIALAAVPLLGPCWHLIHGNSITYDGWRVPVPRGFFLHGEGVMWRLAFGNPFIKAPYGHISLFTRQRQPFNFAINYSRYEKDIVENAAASGYSLKAQRTIWVDKHQASCFEFERPRFRGSTVRCAVDGTPMALFYEGDPKYVPEFFDVLAGMSQQL